MPTRIHPVVRYRHARETMAFLERAFGFQIATIYDGPDHSVAHAEVSFGTGTLGVSSAGPHDPANAWTTVQEGIYVALADPAAHHAQALAAGARIEGGLQEKDYGSREYSARDSGGHLWSFGSYSMNAVEGPAVFMPELHYADGDAALLFLSSAFGFARGLEVRDHHGRLEHAEVWLNGQPLMVAGGDAPWSWHGRQQCTQVRIDDPDEHHAQAAGAGATIIQSPRDTGEGARGYLARDPEGFLWSFSTYAPRSQ